MTHFPPAHFPHYAERQWWIKLLPIWSPYKCVYSQAKKTKKLIARKSCLESTPAFLSRLTIQGRNMNPMFFFYILAYLYGWLSR